MIDGNSGVDVGNHDHDDVNDGNDDDYDVDR